MFKKIAIAAALAIVSSVSMADDTPFFYVGGDLCTTRDDHSSDREAGVGAFAGYQFNQHVALEAGYRRLVDNDVFIDSENVDATTDQIALSALGSLPLGNGFSVYGRLGYNRITAKVRDGGVSYEGHANRGLYGIGVSYSFRKLVSLRLEVQKPMSDITNLSAGVAFRF